MNVYWTYLNIIADHVVLMDYSPVCLLLKRSEKIRPPLSYLDKTEEKAIPCCWSILDNNWWFYNAMLLFSSSVANKNLSKFKHQRQQYNHRNQSEHQKNVNLETIISRKVFDTSIYRVIQFLIICATDKNSTAIKFMMDSEASFRTYCERCGLYIMYFEIIYYRGMGYVNICIYRQI